MPLTDQGPWDHSWPQDRIKRWHNERGIPWGTPFEGQNPITVSMMETPATMNLTVHLANEHGVTPNDYEGTQIEHALAHVYGQFRPGQGHYHVMPGVSLRA